MLTAIVVLLSIIIVLMVAGISIALRILDNLDFEVNIEEEDDVN